MTEAAAVLDQPGAVREENNFDPARILPFLQSKIAGLADGPLELKQFQGGASNVTYLLKVGEREMILRRPPAGTKAKTAHDMGREFRILQRLNPHFPCPKPLAYCEDQSLIGSDFYVMEKFQGVILRRDLPKGLSYTPEQARQLCLNLIDTLIRLHTLDYEKAGLADLGKPAGYVERQVSGWCERFEKVITDDVPKYATVMAWIKAKRPPDSPRPGIIHNDYRFDNVVLSPRDNATIIGVLDWEMATLGDPLMDLGNSLAYWVQRDDPQFMQPVRMQPCNIPGMLSRDEIVRYYAERTGREIGNYDFYHVFGLFRLAVIAQQIYYRFKLGQTTNPKFQAFGVFVTVLSRVAEAVIEKSAL
ncbi:MAG: phosphotransferase family protein [Nevskia sp.]|nr:phosphotransferase family protein [Nevskia sp.]